MSRPITLTLVLTHSHTLFRAHTNAPSSQPHHTNPPSPSKTSHAHAHAHNPLQPQRANTLYRYTAQYWDTSVTFNLENEDEEEDEEASDDAPADAKADGKGTSTGGQSSLATSDETREDDVKDVKDGKKKVKVPEEDAVVKFDRYLGKQWKNFLKKNHFSPDAEDTATGQSSQEGSDAGAQLRRRGLTRASLFGGLSGGRRGGTDRSNYKKRVDSEMAASDFME